ncbi:MAG TPA: dienelactone hydrolase family protein [Ktedonobacterales bacterium]|nr:dienelactone hydrolase family protein [Ktedonobacterales bacterium]
MTDDSLTNKGDVSVGTISYRSDGSTIDGYLARPSDGAAHPGVILIQEWWGIDSHIKELAERLARQGYIVLAPDLYHGKVVHEPDEAGKTMMALNMDNAVTEIRHGIDALQSRDDVAPKKLGIVGFCMGGYLAWKTAEAENGEIAALAAFYGAGYQPTADDIRKITAPVLAQFGDEDASIPEDHRRNIGTLLKQEGKIHKVLVYHAGHAFMNDQHGAGVPEAADQAWAELLAWFKQYLG